MNKQDSQERPLYRHVAAHYRAAIELGALTRQQKLPSLRNMMRVHDISLSTAVQACRYLESEGWVEARSRSGYFVIGVSSAGQQQQEHCETDTREVTNVDIYSASTSAILALARTREVSADLSGATCAPQLYPAAALRKLAVAVMRENKDILASPSSELGNSPFKKALARCALSRGIKVLPEEITVTHGASESLALALRVVTKPGDAVLLESPTYYGVLQLLHSLGVEAIELPTSTTHGLLPEAVEFALREHPRVAAVVNMPTLHNPLGCTMPNKAREKLVALCAAHDVALIEDDVYADLHPAVRQMSAQKSWDRSGHVIYCASLNKSLSPGLRLGWMLGGRWRDAIEALKMTESRPKEELQQQVVARFLEGGSFDRYLKRLHAVLDRQRQEMIALIRKAFPDGSAVHDVDAGLLLWVKLPEGVSSRQLFCKALDNRIRIMPGAIFSSSSFFDGYIRLSCGWPMSKERAEAVAKLGRLCREMMSKSAFNRIN